MTRDGGPIEDRGRIRIASQRAVSIWQTESVRTGRTSGEVVNRKEQQLDLLDLGRMEEGKRLGKEQPS